MPDQSDRSEGELPGRARAPLHPIPTMSLSPSPSEPRLSARKEQHNGRPQYPTYCEARRPPCHLAVGGPAPPPLAACGRKGHAPSPPCEMQSRLSALRGSGSDSGAACVVEAPRAEGLSVGEQVCNMKPKQISSAQRREQFGVKLNQSVGGSGTVKIRPSTFAASPFCGAGFPLWYTPPLRCHHHARCFHQAI